MLFCKVASYYTLQSYPFQLEANFGWLIQLDNHLYWLQQHLL
jgi:hypothetical protein